MSTAMLIGFFAGMHGWLEMGIVLLVALLLFGHRLPSVMRSLGLGVVEFKRGLHGSGEDNDDFDDVPNKKDGKNDSDRVARTVSEK